MPPQPCAVAGKNISISHALSTPDTLNSFLQTHNGYVGEEQRFGSFQTLPACTTWNSLALRLCRGQ